MNRPWTLFALGLACIAASVAAQEMPPPGTVLYEFPPRETSSVPDVSLPLNASTNVTRASIIDQLVDVNRIQQRTTVIPGIDPGPIGAPLAPGAVGPATIGPATLGPAAVTPPAAAVPPALGVNPGAAVGANVGVSADVAIGLDAAARAGASVGVGANVGVGAGVSAGAGVNVGAGATGP
jgi:hypothetical protein